jgi:uncharacterized protein YecE (DUF72 family)
VAASDPGRFPVRGQGQPVHDAHEAPTRPRAVDEALLLESALDQLPPGRHAFEFRHPSWFSDEVLELLRFHHVALVIGHHPERPWQPHELTTGWTFLRFHYGERGRRGNYSESELREWAPRVRSLADRAEVFAYFNNDWEGFAVRNALRLRRLVES